MPLDNVLDIFFSFFGGNDALYFAGAAVVLCGIFSVLVRRFQDV